MNGSARHQPSDADVLAAVTRMLRARTRTIGAALQRPDYPHPRDTTARAWHNGYFAAMRDALKMIDNREGEYPMTMLLRRERPDVEALRKFVLAAAALLSMLAVSGFILWHLAEFGTPGEIILLLIALDAISRFHTVLDRWKELRGESKSSSEALVAKLARVGERDFKAVPPVSKEGDGKEAPQTWTRLAPSETERKAAEREEIEREAAEEEVTEEETAKREAAEKAAKKKTK